jgi:hypothetical protein
MQSKEIVNCADISGHIIANGGDESTMLLFIAELRRPAVRRGDYHPIVIVRETALASWGTVAARFNDIYFIKGTLTKTATFSRVNINAAFSVVILSALSVRLRSADCYASLNCCSCVVWQSVGHSRFYCFI